MEELRELVNWEEGKRLWTKIDEAARQSTVASDRVAELRKANQGKEATELYFSPQVSQLRGQLHDAIIQQAAHEEKQHEKAQEQLLAVEARVKNVVTFRGIAASSKLM